MTEEGRETVVEDLPAGVQDLFDTARRGFDVPAESAQRVLHALSLAAPVVPPADAPVAGGTGSQEGGAPAGVGAGVTGERAAAAGATVGIGLVKGKLAAVVVGIMIGSIGTLAGQRLASVARPSPTAVAIASGSGSSQSAPAVSVAQVATHEALSSNVSTSAPAVAGSHLPATAAPLSASSTTEKMKDRSLQRERALIEGARTALARGQAASAMDLLSQHATEFPRGELRQEREALWVHSLVAVGRKGEAAERANRFQRDYPNGMMTDAVKAAASAQ